MEMNMTQGNPARMIVNFTIPIFLGNLFQQVYTIVDTIIVGKFVSTQALAAVGSTGIITFLILGFLLGLMAGITVITSQRFGAQDLPAMRRSIYNASVIAAAVSILLTIISMSSMRLLLRLMNTPDDIYADAYIYIMIICGGILAQGLYNLLACFLRAVGNSKAPLYFLLLSASLNIILDLVTIIVFHMGVAGAAYATVISQGVSGILCLFYIIRKVPLLHLTKEDMHFNSSVAAIQLRVGLPMAFQYSITAIGGIMVQSALNSLGSMYVAAFTSASKVENIVGQVYNSLGSAMATYSAQNIGAGKTDRVRQGFRVVTIGSIVISIFLGALLYFCGHYTTILFVSTDIAEVDRLIDIYMKCTALFLIPLAIIFIYRNGIQGMGFGFMPMMAGVAELIGRAVTAMIASHHQSYFGVCMASPMAWVLASSLLLATYIYIVKKSFLFIGKPRRQDF